MPSLKVLSLPQDKPKILFYGAMMAIQNFGFHLMYYNLYTYIPGDLYTGCQPLRFWVGFFAFDCFVESFVCLWMAMGGYTDDICMFAFGWILHLIVALPYCICTVTIPIAMYSDDGLYCRENVLGREGDVLVATYWVHCGLFMVYVWMMLSITYFSFLKPSFVTKLVSTTSTEPIAQ